MKWSRLVLRSNAVFLGVASVGGLLAWDVPAIFFGTGPEARVLGPVRYAGLGFLEAHGLAFILGVLLWRTTPSRSWHLVAAFAEMLLGSANLVFWEIFSVADVMAAGYGSTTLHFPFVALNLAAAAILAPVGEELFFRGFATTAWRRTNGGRAALVRGSLCFAFVHVLTLTGSGATEAAGFALVAFVARLPISFALGWVFIRRGSVWAPIGMHAAFNGIQVLTAAALGEALLV